MIRPAVVLHYIGKITIIIGLAMLTSLVWAIYYHEHTVSLILISSLSTIVFGYLLSYLNRNAAGMNYREGFAVVTLSWVAASLIGTIPFLFSGYFPSFADALFETVSGFTTTGASVLTDIEVLPRSLLYWRALTQWLGGMGIMALFVAIMVGMGVRANQVFRAEVPGPVSDKISPRIRETAKALWITYVIISALLAILLFISGMNLFDALCHTFATMATGGFSTKNQSIAYYSSPLIQWIIIIFMFIAGTNFSLHYLAFKNKSPRVYRGNMEFKLYSLAVAIASLIVLFSITGISGIEEKLRVTLFQVISIMTTTGYATVDFDAWSASAKWVLLTLMLIGGSAGSTAGSIKVGRYMIMLQRARIELDHFVHPRAMIPQRFSGRVISDALIINVLQFFFIYILLLLVGTLCMTLMKMDILSAFSAVLACLSNVGPGLGLVGPVKNYAFIPDAGKYVLSLLMLLGRLEIYPVLVLFLPLYWKK